MNEVDTAILAVIALFFIVGLWRGIVTITWGVIIVLVVVFVSSLFFSHTEQWQQSILIQYILEAVERSRSFINDMTGINLGQ